MAGLLTAHLTLEEQTALPLFESDMPAADYKKLEARARKATPRPQAQFLVPWVIAHATPDQRTPCSGRLPLAARLPAQPPSLPAP